MADQQSFASYVATLRKNKGLTQKGLAEKLDFTPQGISRFESLDSSFDLRLVDKLCRALDISFQELCARKVNDTHYVPADLDLTHLNIRLSDARKKKGLTQAELAKQAGITSRSLRLYESGESLPSFQTLSRLSTALGLPLEELFFERIEAAEEVPVIEEEPIPTPPPYAAKRFTLVMAIAAGLVFAGIVGAALPLGLSALENRRSHTAINAGDATNPSGSVEVSQTVPYSPSYEAPEQEYPNYLSVDMPTNEFSSLGEEIPFTLYDPDGNYSFSGLEEKDIVLFCNDSTLDIDFAYLGDGAFTATVNEGKTGGIALVEAIIKERTFGPITYFRYVNGDTVSATDSTPFTDGVLSGAESISLSRQRKANARIYLNLNGEPVSFDPSVRLSVQTMSLPAMATYYEEDITIGMDEDGFNIQFSSPWDLVSDDIYFFVGVEIQDGEWTRDFSLKPWHLHLLKAS